MNKWRKRNNNNNIMKEISMKMNIINNEMA